jgi:hypothetical protein
MGIDRDEDDLGDGVETGTGVFVNASDTGTSAANPDTDGDGFNDGFEVLQGSDPNDPLSTPGGASLPAAGPLGWLVLAGLLTAAGRRAVGRSD